MANCTTLTPRLPKPALMASAAAADRFAAIWREGVGAESTLKAFAAAGFAALLLSGPAAPIGNVIAVRNIAAVQTPPGAAAAAKVKAPVHSGDVVATGANSAVRAQLADGTFFSLGANGRMTIDKFVYDPSSGKGALVASFSKGALRFVGGKLSKKELVAEERAKRASS